MSGKKLSKFQDDFNKYQLENGAVLSRSKEYNKLNEAAKINLFELLQIE